jgi:hypothetical protein
MGRFRYHARRALAAGGDWRMRSPSGSSGSYAALPMLEEPRANHDAPQRRGPLDRQTTFPFFDGEAWDGPSAGGSLHRAVQFGALQSFRPQRDNGLVLEPALNIHGQLSSADLGSNSVRSHLGVRI